MENRDLIGKNIKDWINIDTNSNKKEYLELLEIYKKEIKEIEKCGGEISIEKQHSKGKMTARERINHLIDDGSSFFELGLYAA